MTLSTDLKPLKVEIKIIIEFETISGDTNDRLPRFGLKSNLTYLLEITLQFQLPQKEIQGEFTRVLGK